MGLIERARSGDQRAIARLLTLVENDDPLGHDAIEQLYPQTGSAHRIGFTGPPGAGKSSLINRLIAYYRTEGRRVGVVAIDPTSPLSGGATLGDRIRLMDFHADPNVFIRSMASRGHHGGLAATTSLMAHVLDALGYDPILIETLGVGQDEVDVARLVDTVVLVQVPGLGDVVQTLKAGIFEIGDVIAINKTDLPGANSLARDLRSMVGLGHAIDGWITPVLTVSASTGEGMLKLAEEILAHRNYLGSNDRLAVRRRAAVVAEIEVFIRRELERIASTTTSSDFKDLVTAAAERRRTPRSVAQMTIQTGPGARMTE